MRPVPRTATLNDFIVGNTFAQLQDRGKDFQLQANEGNNNDGVKIGVSKIGRDQHGLLTPSPGSRDAGQPATPTRVLSGASGVPGQQEPGGKRAALTGQLSADSASALSNLEFGEMLKMELANMEAMLASEQRSIGCLTHSDDEPDAEINGVAVEEWEIKVALDSGAVDSVIHPDELPPSVVCSPNTTGRHFTGANNSHIENFGSAETMLQDPQTKTRSGCRWKLADVVRPLHAVCKITGTTQEPKQDVLFTAGKAVVVPAGVVERVLKTIKPLMQYNREGDLYIAKLTMSSFPRQGVKA